MKLIENENKLLREERDNNKKIIDIILDHNTSLLKHNETLHQNLYSSKSPTGTTGKTSKDNVNKKLPADLSQQYSSQKRSKESNENVISSNNSKNGNNVVYILSDSMIKHVNGRNVSERR